MMSWNLDLPETLSMFPSVSRGFEVFQGVAQGHDSMLLNLFFFFCHK